MVRPVSQNMAAFAAVLMAAVTGTPMLRGVELNGGGALHAQAHKRVRPTVARRTTHFAANGAREMERRQRQIARGQLKKANGLVSDV